MRKRGDIARRRFISWALAWAKGSSYETAQERAEYGFERTLSEVERGGSGVGPATARRAERERAAWMAEIITSLGVTP